MRNPERIDKILELLGKAWHTSGWENMRFGQFLSNFIGELSKKHKIYDIWFPEDNNWEIWIKEWLDEKSQKS